MDSITILRLQRFGSMGGLTGRLGPLMARIQQMKSKHESCGRDGEVQVERASGQSRPAALSLLLTGQSASSGSSVRQFLDFASQQNVSLEHLWHARRAGVPIASTLIVPAAGRTAMIFVSPLPASGALGVTTDLLRVACQALDPRQVRLVQTLLEPSQVPEVKSFTAAGFLHLGHLLYMQCKPGRPRRSPDVAIDVEVSHWSEPQRGLFADTILASYEKTMDCPGLIGLRTIDDIIQGHMASGQFDPKLWYALHHSTEPVGVMLLNPVPQQDSLELVYLGVAEKYRGRGLGRKLLEHAMEVATEGGFSTVILAVDEQNDAAVRLYRSMRFAPTARKLALIFPVP